MSVPGAFVLCTLIAGITLVLVCFILTEAELTSERRRHDR